PAVGSVSTYQRTASWSRRFRTCAMNLSEHLPVNISISMIIFSSGYPVARKQTPRQFRALPRIIYIILINSVLYF
ncbi:hypothetical protein ABHC53_21440, partial [Parabacteroides distasonis]|uniref:hypothetical protein n=1 Tax=Parabacteroides distasonis TaxID=823 RepID=UPI00325AFBC9